MDARQDRYSGHTYIYGVITLYRIIYPTCNLSIIIHIHMENLLFVWYWGSGCDVITIKTPRYILYCVILLSDIPCTTGPIVSFIGSLAPHKVTRGGQQGAILKGYKQQQQICYRMKIKIVRKLEVPPPVNQKSTQTQRKCQLIGVLGHAPKWSGFPYWYT